MVVIIQVWTDKYSSYSKSCSKYPVRGLGDKLRGTIGLHQKSKIMGFEFHVDFQLSTLSKLFTEINHPYKDLVLKMRNDIKFIDTKDMNEFLSQINWEQNDVILICSDYYPKEEISDECRNYILNLFKPNEELDTYLNLYIPKYNYDLYHFRMGDSKITNKNNSYDEKYDEILLLLREELKNKDKIIVISDDQKLKNFLSDNEKSLIIFDNEIVHFARCNECESIKETLMDFYLISKADKVKSFSVYERFSGFVLWTAKLFDIKVDVTKNF